MCIDAAESTEEAEQVQVWCRCRSSRVIAQKRQNLQSGGTTLAVQLYNPGALGPSAAHSRDH